MLRDDDHHYDAHARHAKQAEMSARGRRLKLVAAARSQAAGAVWQSVDADFANISPEGEAMEEGSTIGSPSSPLQDEGSDDGGILSGAHVHSPLSLSSPLRDDPEDERHRLHELSSGGDSFVVEASGSADDHSPLSIASPLRDEPADDDFEDGRGGTGDVLRCSALGGHDAFGVAADGASASGCSVDEEGSQRSREQGDAANEDAEEDATLYRASDCSVDDDDDDGGGQGGSDQGDDDDDDDDGGCPSPSGCAMTDEDAASADGVGTRSALKLAGNAHLACGELDEAIDAYQAALAAPADGVDGVSDADSGDGAGSAGSSVIGGSPGDLMHAAILSNLALALLRAGRSTEAAEAAAMCVAARPEWAKAHHRQGCALYSLGRYADALECLVRARSLCADDGERQQVARAIERCLSKGGFDQVGLLAPTVPQ